MLVNCSVHWRLESVGEYKQVHPLEASHDAAHVSLTHHLIIKYGLLLLSVPTPSCVLLLALCWQNDTPASVIDDAGATSQVHSVDSLFFRTGFHREGLPHLGVRPDQNQGWALRLCHVSRCRGDHSS